MFSGIVEAVGRITHLTPREVGFRLSVAPGNLDLSDVGIGDSIAHNGVCLTVVEKTPDHFCVDVSPETLSCTVGLAEPGPVNLERALRLADRLGGHLVSGHVDGVGNVVRFDPIGDNRLLEIQAPAELAKYIARKGSITVDGVSLTTNSVEDSTFTINLIPHTLEATTLHRLHPGAKVNLEVDLIARYVERMLNPEESNCFTLPPPTILAFTQEIVAELKAGGMVILVDEEDRENEGDLVLAADFVTPDAINFMAKHGRGLICLTITEERCRQLGLTPMARDNKSVHGTAFTVSIEAAEGVTTGISAHDRAHTIAVAVARNAKPADIVQPGHVFPITAKPGGVLVRAGHTEAGCDLTGLAGLTPAAVICEIMNEDGTMARLPQLIEVAKEHGLKIGAIADLIHYRSQHETLVEPLATKTIQTRHGEFTLHGFHDRVADEVHLALVRGTIRADQDALVRVHEPLSVLDFLAPETGHHTFSIDTAQAALAKFGNGVIVMLHRPQSGADLREALAAPAEDKHEPKKWDPRIYGIGAQILRQLGVGKMKLLSSPRRMPSMTGFDLEVTGFVTDPESL